MLYRCDEMLETQYSNWETLLSKSREYANARMFEHNVKDDPPDMDCSQLMPHGNVRKVEPAFSGEGPASARPEAASCRPPGRVRDSPGSACPGRASSSSG